MGKKRKLFLGNRPITGTSAVKSRRVARKITTEYHQKINEIAKLKQRTSKVESSPLEMETKDDRYDARIRELEKELSESGGIDRYQQASVISTSHFKTSRWVIRSLDQLEVLRKGKGKDKLQVLEVGAINIQLHSCSFMKVKSIDLNSQHPLIEEIDFFDIPTSAAYDVVVSSMVINCVPSPKKRAEMLARLNAHLKGDGILFLVLPTRCITSKYIGGLDLFNKVLRSVGLVDVKSDKLETKTSPKLSYFILKRSLPYINIPGHVKITWQMILSQATQNLEKGGKSMKRFVVNSSSCNCKGKGVNSIDGSGEGKERGKGQEDTTSVDDKGDIVEPVSEFSMLFSCGSTDS